MSVARLIFVLCFALAIANCPPASAQATAGGSPGLETPSGPVVELPERLYDFGDLTDGKEYVHSFVVKNVGTAPLEIIKVIKI
ncbi:MAG: hypothetical protein ABSC04_09040 [Syntrophobacteraceae bacterium]|jgi:hypothetical protein